MSGYLPPIVVEIRGDSKAFLADLAADKAALVDFAQMVTQTTLAADSVPLDTDLAVAKTRLATFAKETWYAGLGVEVHNVEIAAQLASVQATIAKAKADMLIHANIVPAIFEATTLQKHIDDMVASMKVEIDHSAFLASVDATIALARSEIAAGTLGGGEGGGGGVSILSLLGWGKGIAGMAGLGSVLSLLGLGAEHAIASGVGIFGSMLGAALGGGLLAGGAASTMLVGMGTDMAGFMQASTDIKTYVTDVNNLRTAIADYGKGSLQAIVAQRQLNLDVKNFGPVARQAVVAAGKTAIAFGALFDKVTGPAEAVAAKIENSLMKVFAKFLPTIGASALQNMNIFVKDLKPLFAWIDNTSSTGGLGIFKNLEHIFTSQLPLGIHAVTQGIELFAKTMNVAAGFTGGFLKAINSFLTKANGKDFAGWKHEIGVLIGLFKTWLGLLGSVVGLVAAVFKPAVGFGKAFAEVLTQIVHQITGWLHVNAGTLHSLFSAHLAEVIGGIGGLIKAALPGIEAMVKGFLQLATVGATIASGLLGPLKVLVHFITGSGVGRFLLEWGTAAVLAASGFIKLGRAGLSGLSSLLGLWRSLPARIASAKASLMGFLFTEDAVTGETQLTTAAMVGLSATGILVVAAGVYELIHHFGVFKGLMIAGAAAVGALTIAFWALDAVPVVAVVVGIALAIAGLVAGIYELVTHWKTVWRDVTGFTKTAAHDIERAAVDIWHFLVKVWGDVNTATTSAWNHVVSFVSSIPSRILAGLKDLGSLLLHLAEASWNDFLHAQEAAAGLALKFVKSIPGMILKALGNVGNLLYAAGRAIIDGLTHGMLSVVGGLVHAAESVGNFVVNGVRSILHIGSPSKLMQSYGVFIVQGLTLGIQDPASKATALSHFKNLASAIVAYLKSLVPVMRALGIQLMQGLAAGIQAGTAAAVAAAVAAANAVVAASKAATGTHSPSLVFAAEARDWMLGLVQGIESNAGLVSGAMAGASLGAVPRRGMLAGAGGGASIVINQGPVTINAPTGNASALANEFRKAMSAHDQELIARLRSGVS